MREMEQAGQRDVDGGAGATFGAASTLGWLIRTAEIKGFSTFAERYGKGVSCEYAQELVDHLRDQLSMAKVLRQAPHVELKVGLRSLRRGGQRAGLPAERGSERGAERDMHIRGQHCYCGVQASPTRRERPTPR